MAFASDSFTGSNGTALETYSANWTKVSGTGGATLTINGNAVYASSQATWQMYQWNAAQASGADYEVQADFLVGLSGNVSPGICGRLVSGSNNDAYFVDFHGGSWTLWKRVSGSVSSIGTYSGDAPTTAKTCVLRMSGTTISVYINGVQRISVTDSSLSAKGYAGLGSYYADYFTTRTLDNFAANNLSQTVSINQASETGTSQAVSKLKRKAISQASETSASQAIARIKTRAFAQVSESNSAQAMASKKTAQVGVASETNEVLTMLVAASSGSDIVIYSRRRRGR